MPSVGIVRAGPFYNGNSYYDEPSPVSEFIRPVNCANDDSEAWNWRYYVEYNDNVGSASYVRDDPKSAITENLTASGSQKIVVIFYYQAFKSMTLSYDITASVNGDFSDLSSVSVSVDSTTVSEVDDPDDPIGYVNIAGNMNMPAAIVPIQVVFSAIAAESLDAGETSTANIQFSIS